MNDEGKKARPHQAQGEAYVWLTAMGLTVGLAMILFLLGLVLVKGLGAFWPKRVVQVTLREGSQWVKPWQPKEKDVMPRGIAVG